jgi:tetratricopeptide (TPR) repeat protein
MLTDRYGLPLSTGSAAARDAYVEAADLALTFYPGAAEAYDRAIAADAGFAMAHAGKAQMLAREGDVAAARAALAAAKGFVSGLSEREASHIAFFDLTFAGRTDDAIAALYPHLTAWPRDALVVSTAANPNGLLGGSGRIGQKHQIAELMDSLAPHYGDDFWFLSYHAMALSEDGRLAPARATIERSVAVNPKNAHAAHGFAHICYESGALEDARTFLSSWLPAYPRDGFFLRASQLAFLIVRNPGGQLGTSIASLSRRHRARPTQRWTAKQNVRCSSVFVALRTRRLSARHRGLAWVVRLWEHRPAATGQRAGRSPRHPCPGCDG